MHRRLGINHIEDWHISDGDLLLYTDSEMPAKEMTKTKSHLQACWTCRVKLEKIEKTISAFVEYLNRDFVDTVAPPPLGWRTFRERLGSVIVEMGGMPPSSGRSEVFGRIPPIWTTTLRLAAGILLTALAGLLAVLFFRVSRLSANQLIQSAQESQDRRILAVPEPVVYQRLQVRGTGTPPGTIVTWDIWNDVDNHRFRQRVEDTQGARFSEPQSQEVRRWRPLQPQQGAASEAHPLPGGLTTIPATLRELEQILRANQMNPSSPLSAVSYESWRESVRRNSEDVKRTSLPNGKDAFTLTTAAAGPFAANAIVRAALVVRAEDWHPIAQQLEVQGEDGVRDYQLTETAFEVTSLKHLDPAIFSDQTLSVPPAPPSRAAVRSPSSFPASTESVSAEIKARYALHRLRACVSESIEVSRNFTGYVEVRGVTQTPERRQELMAALQGIPWVEANIETVTEASLAGSVVPQSTEGSAIEIGDSLARPGAAFQAQSSKLPIEDQLQEYFARLRGNTSSGQAGSGGDRVSIERQIIELSKQAVSLSLAASAQAGALRELADRYPPAAMKELEPVSRWLLEVMMRDHLASLKSQIAQSRALLTPVLVSVRGENLQFAPTGNMGPTAEQKFTDSNWAAATLFVFKTVEHAERLTDHLFAGASLPVGDGEAVANLLDDLNRFPDGFERLQAQIDKDFLVRPDAD